MADDFGFFSSSDNGAPPPADDDPAAAFLAQQESEIAGIENDEGFGALEGAGQVQQDSPPQLNHDGFGGEAATVNGDMFQGVNRQTDQENEEYGLAEAPPSPVTALIEAPPPPATASIEAPPSPGTAPIEAPPPPATAPIDSFPWESPLGTEAFPPATALIDSFPWESPLGSEAFPEHALFAPLELQESNGPTDGYTAIANADLQRQEPESLRKWREEQKTRLEELDSASKAEEAEWRERAKKELEDWHLHQSEQMEKNKANNRASEEAFLEGDEDAPGSEWERVARLCDFNPKTSKQSKDVSRMRSVLISLKQTPLVR